MNNENHGIDLNVVFEAILLDYVATCKVNPFNGNIVVADDMAEEYSTIRKDLIDNHRINIDEIGKYNGLTVQPKNNDGVFSILINKEYFLSCLKNKDMSWVGTIVHEATHVNDFKEYFEMVLANSYDELYDYNLHRLFLYWTEFHAKAMGYFFVRKYTFDDIRDQRQTDDIIQTELPFQIDYMIKEVNATNDADSQMYVVVHFLGRLAVWQYLFPETFNERFIRDLTDDNPWMEELYYFLIKHDTLEKVLPAFDEMRSILDKHFI